MSKEGFRGVQIKSELCGQMADEPWAKTDFAGIKTIMCDKIREDN